MEIDEEHKTKHTCLKLQLSDSETIFVKGQWSTTHFFLSISDALHAWICHASEGEVRERASQWDQPVSEYISLAEHYLGFQQPASVYKFVDAGDGNKRLSWTFEKEGTKLEWRWKCQPSPDSKKITADILDFLMDANIRLSEEVVKKSHLSEWLKAEAEKCLAQSEIFSKEKEEFESAIYAKFIGVLNSKKTKLRELRDKLEKLETTENVPEEEEEESTEKNESFDSGGDDDDKSEEEEAKKILPSTSKAVPPSRTRGRKRIADM